MKKHKTIFLNFFVVILLFLSFQTITFSQVHVYYTYPDFTITEKNGEKYYSTDWEFAEVKLLLKDEGSQFHITLKRQNKEGVVEIENFHLTQIIPWISGLSGDGYNGCGVMSDKGNKMYGLNLEMDSRIASNRIILVELIDKKPAGRVIELTNSEKRQAEILMFLGSDGISAYMYSNRNSNSLASKGTNLARKFASDNVNLCYTSQETYLDEQVDFLSINYPIEDTYSTFLIHRNISRNLTIKDGVYTYRNDSIPSPSLGYGIGTGRVNAGFDKFQYSWFIPQNIDVIRYKSNRKGSWKKSNNGITFTGEKGINNVLFEISYRIKNMPAKEIEKTKIELKETIEMPSNKVKIDIWDNNVEDGDVISISLNGEWIIKNLEVKKCKTTFSLNLDKEDNYLVMKAENIGSRPPNTAAFSFEAENFKQEVILNSDMGTSEMIRIKVKK